MVTCKTRFKLPDVFVVSSGRSGTTLLTSILNASEQIYIPYESDFIARAYPYYWNKTQFNEEDYKRIVKIFMLSAKEDGWGMSEEHMVRYLNERLPQTFADVNATLYEAFHRQEQTDELLWGIKAPVLISSLDRIHNVCPQAKIVHVIRDGRDVFLSYKRVHETSEFKFGPKGVIQNALYWVDGLRRVEDFLKVNPTHQVYELRYDDLIQDPTSNLKQLCDFLEIEYRPSMQEDFNNLERNKKIAPAYYQQSIHRKLRGGLDARNTKKYLTAMAKLEQLKFELIAVPYLLKYGYQSEYPVLSSSLFNPIRRILYFLARQLNNVRYDSRDRNVYRRSNHPS